MTRSRGGKRPQAEPEGAHEGEETTAKRRKGSHEVDEEGDTEKAKDAGCALALSPSSAFLLCA